MRELLHVFLTFFEVFWWAEYRLFALKKKARQQTRVENRLLLTTFDLKPQPPRPELAGGDVDPPPPVGGAERDANFSTQCAIFHVIACIFCKL